MNKNVEAMNRFLVQVQQDFPELVFKFGNKFSFRAPKTVTIEQFCDQDCGWQNTNDSLNAYQLQVLHEVSHAILRHQDFAADLIRIKMERAAWERARELCERYAVKYDEDYVEEALDTYRDWLHQRSKCPKCGLTRYQTKDGKYYCPGCDA